MTDIEYIRNHVPRSALWDQLGEELAELIQALYKLRRAEGNGNPTPVTVTEARAAVQEEISDVVNCCKVLNLDLSEDLSSYYSERCDPIYVEVIAKRVGEIFRVLREPDRDKKRHSGAVAFYCGVIFERCKRMGYNIDFNPESPKLRRWRERLEVSLDEVEES